MKLVIWSLMSVITIICVALAVDSTTVPVDTVIKHVSDVAGAIKGYGLGNISSVVLLAAIIKLIISTMKFAPVAKWLNTEKMKAAKPYIAITIGILSGIGNNLVTGQDLIISIIAGLAAGLGSVGIHETVKSIQGKNK